MISFSQSTVTHKVWIVTGFRCSSCEGGIQTTELNSAAFQSFGVTYVNSGESQATAWNNMSRKMSRFLTRFSSIVSNGATVKSILPQKRIFVGIRLVSTSTGRDFFILELYCVYKWSTSGYSFYCNYCILCNFNSVI